MKSHYPTSISVECSASEPERCPVRTLFLYLQRFTYNVLNIVQDHYPVTHHFITSKMAKILHFICIDQTNYQGHSFRIGAATHFASLGYSETYIKKLGRWNSNAVDRYIRISSVALNNVAQKGQ